MAEQERLDEACETTFNLCPISDKILVDGCTRKFTVIELRLMIDNDDKNQDSIKLAWDGILHYCYIVARLRDTVLWKSSCPGS